MTESRQYAFTFPELHWLNSATGPSHAVRGITLMYKLLSVPVNHDKGNPALIAHENSSKSTPHLGKSNVGSGKGNDTLIGRDLFSDILKASIGSLSITAVVPIERVCILMQCQNEMIKSGRLSTPYKGMKDCLLRTIKHEGFLSLWRGNSVNVFRLCAAQALPFTLLLKHLPYKNYVQKKVNESHLWVLPFLVMPGVLCYYPLDYARVRLASDVKVTGGLNFSLDSSGKNLRNDIGTRKFSGVLDVYKKTLKLDGIQGLYRGYFISCIGFAAYIMATKELTATSTKQQRSQKNPIGMAIIVTSLIRYSFSVVLYPVLTVSRRMMMTSGEATKYRGAGNAFYQIVKTEGASSLFKGLTPYMIHLTAKDLAMFGFLCMPYLLLKQMK